MKVCEECEIKKELSEFYENKKMKDGYLNSCKICCSKNTKKYREVEVNREKAKESRKKYNKDNKDKIKIYSDKYHKEYYSVNKERIIEYQKQYRIDNISDKKEYDRNYRILNKNKRSEYHKKRKRSDILYRLMINVRHMIQISLRKNGYSKTSKTQEILGCSFEEFKIYLELKFENWMTWENRGKYNGELNYGWDIDHIIPISSAKTKAEIIILNNYTNLQPLCSRINRDIKKDKY